MLNKLLCALGFHLIVRQDKWTPSIMANIVTEFEQKHTCSRCKKVVHHIHLHWNGKDMIKV